MNVMYSVVLPVHNEEGVVTSLQERIERVMENLRLPYEIIWVDDASTDRTFTRLSEIRSRRRTTVLVRLERRSGLSSALQAGFDAARGDWIITLDGDGQNAPEDIPALLSKAAEGYDVVCGWRKNRRDPWLKRAGSAVANRLRSSFDPGLIHDVGCNLRVFRSALLKDLFLQGVFHCFFSTLAARCGYRIGEAEVSHEARRFGRSKFGLWDCTVEGARDWLRTRLMPRRELGRRRAAYCIAEVRDAQ